MFIKKIATLGLIFVSLFVLPVNIATAQPDGEAGGESGSSVQLQNPLAGGNINDIPSLVESLLGIVLVVGVPLIALAIIYAGYKFVTAQGNPDKLEEAKKTFVWIVVGAAILLSAYAIAQGIKATILDIRGN
ncbi:MAG: TrbC/VirB2 family protein [Candidatus Pacebacteria bacterium]|nr:TrbC/VirB2 family protein [Candidatus Paceibacterota bacterium]